MTDLPASQREKLPKERLSKTHKFKVGAYEGYITVGMYPDGRPGEMFLTDMGKEGSFTAGIMGTWAKTFSVALQYGVPLEDLIRKYSHVRFEPGPTQTPAIPQADSVVDYIAKWLALHWGSDELKAELQLPVSGNGGGPDQEARMADEKDQTDQRAEDEQAQKQRVAGEGGGEAAKPDASAEPGEHGDVKSSDQDND